MAKPTLLPDPTCFHLKLLAASNTTITAIVTTTSPEAGCPLWQHCSQCVHVRSVRQVADLPWMGCVVRLELHFRRFFCSNQEGGYPSDCHGTASHSGDSLCSPNHTAH